jgi:Domain of unknown function DUF11
VFGLLALLCAAGLVTAGIAAIATDSSSAAKKRCRTVVKKSRGKAKRVRVCTEAPKTSSKPKPKPKPAPPGADLAVGAIVSPEEIVAGTPMTYRVTVVNQGPKEAKNVVLAIETPIGVDDVRPDPAGGSCDSPGKGPTAFRCRVGTLAVEGSWTVEVVGTPVEDGTIRFAAAARSATTDPAAKNSATEDEVTVKPSPPPGEGEPPPPPLGP